MSEELTLAEMELRDARIDEFDVEGLLEFARDLALNAGKLWTEAPLQARLQLQACLFPDGVRYRHGAILNTTSCPVFSNLEAIQAPKATMVSPRGHDALWIPINQWFPMDRSRRAA